MAVKIKKYWLSILFGCFSFLLAAQVSQVEYGKNRVQYHDDFDQWLYYESQNFITYWYGKSRNHGVATVKYAEQDHNEILDIIEHRINDKIEILVFTDVADLKQSNIGSEETFTSQVGETKIEGNKVFVYFDGNHDHLRVLIRKGIAEVFLNSMFYGSNLQEIVQNSVSSNVPHWFKDGLIDYIGEYWGVEHDNRLRHHFLTEKKTNFRKLFNRYPTIIGHSFWYYIGITYGKSEISNLLYLTRINRDIEDAFLYVFGVPFEDITSQWEEYFKNRYETETKIFDPVNTGMEIDFKRKKRVPISQILYNPDGSKLAIIDNQIGKTKITIENLETGENYRVFKKGFKNVVQATDYNYPVMAWHPDGRSLFIAYEFRDKIVLRLENFETGEIAEQILPERYQRIFAMSALSDRELIFSAFSDGMVDLFYYTTHTRQSTPLNRDIYDDLDIRTGKLNGNDGIYFSSNRPDVYDKTASVDTLLPFENFNLFFLALEEDAPQLYQLTYNKTSDLRHPIPLGNGKLTFLTTENGITNRKTASVLTRVDTSRVEVTLKNGTVEELFKRDIINLPDSLFTEIRTLSKPQFYLETIDGTNLLNSILLYDVSPATNKTTELHLRGNDFQLYEKPLSSFESGGDIGKSMHLQMQRDDKPQDKSIVPPNIIERREEEVVRSTSAGDGKKYLFQSEFGDMIEKEEKEVSEAPYEAPIKLNALQQSVRRSENDPINRLRIVPYQLRFKIHDVSTNMDNSLLFGGLDSYAGFKREYEPPPLGILIKADFKDLFEDYVFQGGVRIPTSFNGTEFFLVFDDKKKRLDKRYALYRRSNSENQSDFSNNLQRTRSIILLGQFGVRYPLDIYQSLRATATLRQDKFTVLAADRNSLNEPDQLGQRIGIKLEYVFDNSIDVDVNIRSGSRVKVFTEAVKKFSFSLDPLELTFNNGFMTVVGLDARHYFNFAKHAVLAVRGVASTSFGSEKILYYLGSTDNALIPKFNEQIPQPPGVNFAYQTISPNLRGFDYNIRNGSSFALINAELRIPFLKYLSQRPIRMSFLRHMQVIGFVDAGAAWEGISPFDEDNPINILDLENPPTVRLKVNYYREPVVVGYGIGARTMLFGYFIRLDYAWGVETGIVQKPKWHFSLGLDF